LEPYNRDASQESYYDKNNYPSSPRKYEKKGSNAFTLTIDPNKIGKKNIEKLAEIK
jgi:hypothetical protein